MGALSGIRVLDLSRVLAAPFATQLLGDMGAEVIKVERPGEGDETRGFGPPFLRSQEEGASDAAYFLTANRNKKSIAVDFSKPEGASLLRNLANSSDVVVENYRTGSLAKYGLDYQTLKAGNPSLIYCSLTGFGHTGPYRDKAGYDYLMQGMGGLMSVTGHPDGVDGAEPMKVGVAVSDLFCGLFAANAIQSALIHRFRTGLGQSIDMALFDCQVATLVNQGTNYLCSGEVPQRVGNAHSNIVPYQVFKSADGHVILAVANDGQFARFCDAIGLAALASDPRFQRNGDRVRNRELLIPLLREPIIREATEHWITLWEAANVPCGRINRIDEVFADPQSVARGHVVEMAHPVGGVARLIASPMRLEGTPSTYRYPPPLLGEHTHEILTSVLGLSDLQMKSLEDDGVIAGCA